MDVRITKQEAECMISAPLPNWPVSKFEQRLAKTIIELYEELEKYEQMPRP